MKLEGGDKVGLADISFVVMSCRFRLTVKRREEERVGREVRSCQGFLGNKVSGDGFQHS